MLAAFAQFHGTQMLSQGLMGGASPHSSAYSPFGTGHSLDPLQNSSSNGAAPSPGAAQSHQQQQLNGNMTNGNMGNPASFMGSVSLPSSSGNFIMPGNGAAPRPPGLRVASDSLHRANSMGSQQVGSMSISLQSSQASMPTPSKRHLLRVSLAAHSCQLSINLEQV